MTDITREEVRRALGKRRADCHKGDNGRGLLLAGSPGMSGAAVMAATASLRGGIGTLKVFCPEDVRPAFYALPEAMGHAFPGDWNTFPADKLAALLDASDCVAAGPGLGKEPGVLRAVLAALAAKKPTVLDADALNALAGRPGFSLHARVVVTPHPGEMGRLTQGDPLVTRDPAACAVQYARKWGCVVLLKGAQSVIAAPDGSCKRNVTGNAGLAKGGSGDVLTGILLSLLGQGLEPFAAACAGAYLLGASADVAVELLQERMLMARDVTDMIRVTLHGVAEEDP